MTICYNAECPVRPSDGECGCTQLCDRFMSHGAKVITSDKTEVVYDVPETSNKTTPLNGGCITGKSPSGHCGSAAFCPGPHRCCASCKEDCNIRCGFLEQGV